MEEMISRKFTFKVPSGYIYTIREQNGADDDILSNPVESQTLTNISRFIAGIVVETNFTKNNKLNIGDVDIMPVLDKYCILINSRIFSIGKEVYFEHNWGPDNGGIVNYEQDLNELVFDYGETPTKEILESKPFAIPYYPLGDKIKDIEFTLSSGKIVKFDLLTTKGESYILKLPMDKRTKNQELVARNLQLLVDGRWDKVTSFHLFSIKDMMEIRSKVYESDPIFYGNIEIENPHDSFQKEVVNIIGLKDFFYPGEI